MGIKYLELSKITAMHVKEIHEAVNRVVDSGWYLQGNEVAAFEKEYASYIGTSYCVTCANGLDALRLMIRAYKEIGRLKDGDEVIVPANTYIATILAVTENNLKPVLVEPRLDTFQIDDNQIEKAITPLTRAILIVHLYGKCAYTHKIEQICQEHHLILMEDNAQAHGCVYWQEEELSTESPLDKSTKNGHRTGSLGHAAAHSFYPGKNLGALGDAGALTTEDEELASVFRTLANYGSPKKYVFDYEGFNSRMDEIQAAVLRVKLQWLDQDTQKRKAVADKLIAGIEHPLITVPSFEYACSSVFHIFPILCKQRDRLQQYLAEHGVQTIIHYPIPPHHQKCYSSLIGHLSLPITEQIHQQELSIPCAPYMSDDDTTSLIQILNAFS